jgi:hypothetical protein
MTDRQQLIAEIAGQLASKWFSVVQKTLLATIPDKEVAMVALNTVKVAAAIVEEAENNGD